MAFPDFYDALGLPQFCTDKERIYAAYAKKMEEFAPYATKGDSFVMYSGDLYFHIWYYNIAYLTLSDALHTEFLYRMGVIWRDREREEKKRAVIAKSVAVLLGLFLLFLASLLYDFFLS